VNPFAVTPEPPYCAVIFSSLRTADDPDEYEAMAARMLELAATMPGYLGVESARGADGFGITVSYWTDAASIENWKRHTEHQVAQSLGRTRWYERFALRTCQVVR
jgi:heme-degrading monooxygenase HmoA